MRRNDQFWGVGVLRCGALGIGVLALAWSTTLGGSPARNDDGAARSPALSDTSPYGRIARKANKTLGLADSTIATLEIGDLPGTAMSVIVPLGEELFTLELAPSSVRAAGYQVLVSIEDGSYVEVEPQPVRTMRGVVVEVPGSAVAASLLEDGLYARIILSGDEEYWIEPIGSRVEGAVPGDYAIYRTDDIIPSGKSCGADALSHPLALGGDGAMGGGTREACGNGILCRAELACDADFEYYQDYGSSVPNVENQINSIINTVNIQYERDVEITHEITTIIVRSGGNPSSYNSASTIGALLDAFRSYWISNHGGIPRDLAELFTGRNLSGSIIGVAWLNGVCNTWAYSVVENCCSFGCLTDLSAHELGHNWGANHCSCSTYTMNSGLTCFNRFHPTFTIPEIVSYRNNRQFCLDAGACDTNDDCDDGTFCNGAETCDGNGECQPGPEECPGQQCRESDDSCVECLIHSNCTDGLWCNGLETCDGDGNCQPGSDRCPGQFCREEDDTCVECTTSAHCDDGAFCNGTETCDVNGDCQDVADPCVVEDWCDEGNDVCVPVSTRMFMLPAGMGPGGGTAGTPFRITAVGGEEIAFDVWAENSDPAAAGTFQVQMPCVAEGGDTGYVEFTSRALDEGRTDYIFSDVTTFGLGGNDGTCPGGGLPGDPFVGSPFVATGILSGAPPVVTDPRYVCTWSYTVSNDAQGLFTLTPICYYNDPDPDCPIVFTFLADPNNGLIPFSLDPLEIEVPFGQCCYDDGVEPDLQCVETTGFDCSDTFNGHMDGSKTCLDECLLCMTNDDCDDGDACTIDVCDLADQSADVFGCVFTYEARPYGDIQPIPDPPATFPCDAEELARAGDGFLTMLDVMCAFNAMNDGAPFTNCPCADVQPCGGDNFLTMLDVMSIFNTMNDPASAPCPNPCP